MTTTTIDRIRTLVCAATVAGLLAAPGSAWAGLDEANEAAKRGDYAAAVAEIRPLAEAGNPRAQNMLGHLYFQGRGVSKDHKLAAHWFLESAQQGYAEAQLMLFFLYSNGDGVPKDVGQAMSWLSKAAEAGAAHAQFIYGSIHSRYPGPPNDEVDRKAVHWLRKAAEQGHEEAQLRLGEMFSAGRGVPQDDAQAYFWWTLASEAGVAKATALRDEIGKRLTPEQRAQKEAAAREWRPKPSDQGTDNP